MTVRFRGYWLTLAAVMAAHGAAAQEAPARPDTDKDKSAEVVVTAKRQEVVDKIDRRSYDVRSDPSAKTGVLADVLRKIPSVTVTNDDQVELRGQSGVQILIDGKPPLDANALRTLPASKVARVEVMTNPSAQYAPDGTAGIINIVTDKTLIQGLSGNVTAGIGDFGDRDLTANASLTRGKWTLSGGGRAGGGGFSYHGGAHQVTADPADSFDSDTIGRIHMHTHMYNAAVAYKASDVDMVTLSGQGGSGFSRNLAVTTYATPSGGFSESNTQRMHDSWNGLDLNYIHDDPVHGQKLTLDANINGNSSGGATTYGEAPSGIAYRNTGHDSGTSEGVSAEYERTTNQRILIVGAGFSRNDSDTLTTYANLSGSGPQAFDSTVSFGGRQDTAAVYATYQFPAGKWTLLPGLRAEEEVITLPGRLRRHIATLYPTFHLSRNLGEGKQLKLSYSRRTDRPFVSQYDPTLHYTGAKNAWVGNPAIHAVMTDSYEASYDVNGKTSGYTTTVYYRVNHGAYSAFSYLTPEGVLVNTTANAGRDSNGGGEFTVRGQFSPRLKYNLNADVFYDELVDSGVHRGTWTSFGNANLEYDAEKRGDLDGDQYQLSAQWRGKKRILQGIQTASCEVDFNLRHALSRKLAVVVNAYDLFNSAMNTQIIDTPALKVVPVIHPRGTIVKVSLAYMFN